jgi:hypothetical protein
VLPIAVFLGMVVSVGCELVGAVSPMRTRLYTMEFSL